MCHEVYSSNLTLNRYCGQPVLWWWKHYVPTATIYAVLLSQPQLKAEYCADFYDNYIIHKNEHSSCTICYYMPCVLSKKCLWKTKCCALVLSQQVKSALLFIASFAKYRQKQFVTRALRKRSFSVSTAVSTVWCWGNKVNFSKRVTTDIPCDVFCVFKVSLISYFLNAIHYIILMM